MGVVLQAQRVAASLGIGCLLNEFFKDGLMVRSNMTSLELRLVILLHNATIIVALIIVLLVL